MSEFLPLAEAAALAYATLVGKDDGALDHTRRDAHLSYLAGDGAAPRILAPERVMHGTFTKGGQFITLAGDSGPVGGLCVRRADLAAAIEQLRGRLAPPTA